MNTNQIDDTYRFNRIEHVGDTMPSLKGIDEWAVANGISDEPPF
jgi:hypothetical protein